MDPRGHKPAGKATSKESLAEAMRIQAAAVAAQQAELDEQETRLADRQKALEVNEEQVAAELDEKRRHLLLESERNLAERAVLEQERAAFDRQVERFNGDLSPVQRAIVEAEKQILEERKRIHLLQQKLKRRWHQHWRKRQEEQKTRQAKFDRFAAQLAARQKQLDEFEAVLKQRRLRFNGDTELARQHIKETWGKLRQAQFRWKHRRGLERAALRVRAHDLETAAQQIDAARAQLEADQRAWQTQRQALDLELDGVNERVKNQRQVLGQHETRLRTLENQIVLRQQQLVALGAEGSSSTTAPEPVKLVIAPAPERLADLTVVADELYDQRLELVEAWQRLANVRGLWETEHSAIQGQLQGLGHELTERERRLDLRDQARARAEEELRRRHQGLLQFQHEIIASRSRLRTEESAWESDKGRLLADLKTRESQATQQINILAELRKRWAARRQQEIEQLQDERASAESFRQETARLRAELQQRLALLESEQRFLAEKMLALEQYRHDIIGKRNDPHAERRLERARRRWLAQHAESIRRATQDREALQAELRVVEERHEALQRRAAEVLAAQTELTEERIAWEHTRALQESHQQRLEQTAQHADEQRLFTQQQLVYLRDEVEQIARALLDQPDPPHTALENAA